METFGKSKAAWLKQFLKLENGIPAHDTFADVFGMIDAQAFQRSFMHWIEQVFTLTRGQVIAIDGKTARHSYDQGGKKGAIHMVRAWASENGLTLDQRKVDDKSNEITAIPELLALLNVSGCIVTIDAMGCQKKIAQKIRDRKADYLLNLKDNQGKLLQDVQDWFAYTDQVGFDSLIHDYHRMVDKGHGRIEIRECWTVADPLAFEHIRHYDGWADLHSIIRIRRERRLQGKIEQETLYYISSLAPNAKQILHATRTHWAVENSLHWVLDVTLLPSDAAVPDGALRLTITAIMLIVVAEVALQIVLFVGAGRIEDRSERDDRIAAKSSRNAYLVLTLGAFASFGSMFVGFTPFEMGSLLLGAFLLAESVKFASQILYYRQSA